MRVVDAALVIALTLQLANGGAHPLRLFGVTNRSETKRDLLILITPHIVDEGDMTMEPRRSP